MTGRPHGQASSRLYQLGTAGLHAAAVFHGRGQPLFRQRHPHRERFRLRELLPAPAGLGPVRHGLHAAGHAVRLPAAAQSGLARLSGLPLPAHAGAPGGLHLLRRQTLDLLRPVHHPALGAHQDRGADPGGPPAGPRQPAPGLEAFLFRAGRGPGAHGLHPQAARPRHGHDGPADHGRHDPVPRPAPLCAGHLPAGRARRGGPHVVRAHARLPEAACAHLSQSRRRPSGRGLPHPAVTHRHRLGRAVGQGLYGRHDEQAQLFARTPWAGSISFPCWPWAWCPWSSSSSSPTSARP